MQITIVGAGPIGCYLGQLLKNDGFAPVLLEEHSQIGVPLQCAGLVGASFFGESRIPLPENIIDRRINGAIISYKRESFTLQRKNVAFAIDRVKLDQQLSEGLDIRERRRLVGLEKKNGKYLLHTPGESFQSDIVIGADGATSITRKLEGFKLNPTYYKGVLIKMKRKMDPDDVVRVDFSRPFLYFSWLIPQSDGVVRAGSISPTPRKTLHSFLDKLDLSGEIIEQTSGLIPTGYGQTLKGRVALVGDAACQVKPLSGGGLHYGMRCAEILAQCIKEGNLASYETRWKKSLGKEIQSALRIRKVLEKRSLFFLGKLFRLAQKNSALIEQLADFERHSVSVFSVVGKLGLILPGLRGD